ncbi:MAG: Rrf2 family transcriptional regulator [Planctomycetota bacterium]|nr:Rrf2 family transcriptional regulator [Planctomycetota bacterium]
MFSQTTEYALRAMAVLAQSPDQLVSTIAIAERTQVPANYLAKVLQQLAAAGLLAGRRGVGGGYRLARPPQEIALIEIVRAVCEFNRLGKCPIGCQQSNLCALHKIVDHAAGHVIDLFEKVSLQTLLDDETAASRPLCGAK